MQTSGVLHISTKTGGAVQAVMSQNQIAGGRQALADGISKLGHDVDVSGVMSAVDQVCSSIYRNEFGDPETDHFFEIVKDRKTFLSTATGTTYTIWMENGWAIMPDRVNRPL